MEVKCLEERGEATTTAAMAMDSVEADWSIALTRKSRTVVVHNWNGLQQISPLPDRLRPTELTDDGLIWLVHLDERKKSRPWLPGGS